MFTGNAREKMAGQVQAAVERITHSITGVFAIAVLAIAVASGALYVAVRALQASRIAAA